MPEQASVLLKEAIARNAGAVLSLPSAGMIRHHKTRFLAETDSAFWVESVPAERALLSALIAEQSPIGIAFKAGHASIAFTAPIRRRDESFRVNVGTAVEALLLPFPDSLHPRQRRQSYRVRLPEDHDIRLLFWRLGEHVPLEDQPLAATAVSATLMDISVGGIGAICDRNADGGVPTISVQDRLRIVLGAPDLEEILLEGRVVHLRALADGRVVTGVQFKKLQQDLDGRHTSAKLSKLVGRLEREEVRHRATHAA